MRRIDSYRLWLGNAGDAREPRALYDMGIRAVIDLALNEPPAQLPREISYCRFPLVDGAGNPAWLLRGAIDWLATLLRQRVPTLVYCGAGLSRSPAIAAAAIARLEGCQLREGLERATAGVPADVSTALWEHLEEMMG